MRKKATSSKLRLRDWFAVGLTGLVLAACSGAEEPQGQTEASALTSPTLERSDLLARYAGLEKKDLRKVSAADLPSRVSDAACGIVSLGEMRQGVGVARFETEDGPVYAVTERRQIFCSQSPPNCFRCPSTSFAEDTYADFVFLFSAQGEPLGVGEWRGRSLVPRENASCKGVGVEGRVTCFWRQL
jgi:hypothetical protein